MFGNLNYETIVVASVVAYTLAFYFKMNTDLLERHGLLIFVFLHIPIFCGLLSFSFAVPNSPDMATQVAYAGSFLFRFFRKDYV